MRALVKAILGAIALIAVAILGLLVALPARAQTAPYTFSPACLPRFLPYVATKESYFGDAASSHLIFSLNSEGLCVKYYCLPPLNSGLVGSVPKFCGPWAEQAKVGARVQTIQKAADPLKSLQTAGTRFPMVPLSDPSMAGMPR